MRTLAIGDVHGCYDAMVGLLDYVKIKRADQLIWLGDYVDRGPDSARVIEHLIGLRAQGPICLRGNHEIMMQRARHSLAERREWGIHGGGETWDSYETQYGAQGLDAVPESHWDFLDQLLPFHETDNHIFVHASVDGYSPMEDQVDHDLYWGRFYSIGPHQSGKRVVCGHTSQKSGLPRVNQHAVCIDTWACGDGWLTCLDVDTGQYWQANQRGQTRSDWLGESTD